MADKSKIDAQMNRINYLMEYKTISNKKGSNIEYHTIGADGKAYGILKENNMYYIKTADKKDELIAESYNYIGGFNYRNENAYKSYNDATKQLELKLMSLNEAYNSKNSVSTVDFDKNKKGLAALTESAREELNRMKDIMEKSSCIGKPYCTSTEAELDDDFKKTTNVEDSNEHYGLPDECRFKKHGEEPHMLDSVAAENDFEEVKNTVKESEEDEFDVEDIDDDTDETEDDSLVGFSDDEEDEDDNDEFEINLDDEDEEQDEPSEDEEQDEDDEYGELNEMLDDFCNEMKSNDDLDLAQKAKDALSTALNLGMKIDDDYIEDNANELIEEMGADPDELTDDEYYHYIEILKDVRNDNAEDFDEDTLDECGENFSADIDEITESVFNKLMMKRVIRESMSEWGRHPRFAKEPIDFKHNNEERFGKKVGKGDPYSKLVDLILDNIRKKINETAESKKA